MKLTILSADNQILLIKALRSYYSDMTLQSAVNISRDLPYSITELPPAEAYELQKLFNPIASVVTINEPADIREYESTHHWRFNSNINPPPQYLIANVWYESLSNEHKGYVDSIVSWRQRPVVC